MGLYPRLTPWSNWKEWIQVKNGVFSSNISEQIWALEVIKMWRVRGKIPHSVDTSGNLLEVILNDNQPLTGNCCQYQRSESELRLLYAMCIIRGVNGLVESSQQGYFAESVMSLATKIGLPPWFVDLRHDSTHNNLPSINLLRSASRSLLLWCRETYWDQQHIYLENLSYRCLHFDPDNNSSEIIENSNQFDVLFARESTFLANILLPLFHDDILNALSSLSDSSQSSSISPSPSSPSPSSSPNLITFQSNHDIGMLTNYKKEMWELLLLKSLRSHKGAIHMILSSIFSTAINDIIQLPQDSQSSPHSLLYYSILCWWVKNISEKYVSLINETVSPVPVPAAAAPPVYLIGIWERFHSLNIDQQRILESMRAILDQFYDFKTKKSETPLDGIDNNNDNDNGNDNKEEQEEEEKEDVQVVQVVVSKKRNRKRNLESIETENSSLSSIPSFSSSSHLLLPPPPPHKRRMWALGNRSGELSGSLLYLLEEIN